ncbi:MAG: hypothetical protein Fur0017_31510 [Anaerolineales bacterium]
MLLTSLILAVLGITLTGKFGYSANLLFLLGLLSGIVYALTNANDRRIVHGRIAAGEKSILRERHLLAIGGILGVAVTWLMLPVAFLAFSKSLLPTINLSEGIKIAFTSSITISRLGLVIPFGFLWTGILAVINTFAYLYILGKVPLPVFATLSPIVLTVDLLAGTMLFSDKILLEEWFIFPVMLVLYISLRLLDPTGDSDKNQHQEKKEKSKLLVFWIVTFVITGFLSDISTRGALSEFSDSSQFFIALCFRAAYFSMFALFFAFELVRSGEFRSQVANLKRNFWIVLVTPFTFAIGFYLYLPVIAQNLAVGKFVNQAAGIVALSVIGLIYKTDGKSKVLRERLVEVYVGNRERGRFWHVSLYIIFVALVVFWMIVRFLQK